VNQKFLMINLLFDVNNFWIILSLNRIH
jgi:hypothetical protein